MQHPTLYIKTQAESFFFFVGDIALLCNNQYPHVAGSDMQINTHTHTHTECRAVFPLQQWSAELATMLRYTYIDQPRSLVVRVSDY